jgi:hypothetical protein
VKRVFKIDTDVQFPSKGMKRMEVFGGYSTIIEKDDKKEMQRNSRQFLASSKFY